MRRWMCHKVVEAEPIVALQSGTMTANFVEIGAGTKKQRIYLSERFFARGIPEVGDYFVRYGDGYESWSPKAAFEAGYTEMKETFVASDYRSISLDTIEQKD